MRVGTNSEHAVRHQSRAAYLGSLRRLSLGQRQRLLLLVLLYPQRLCRLSLCSGLCGLGLGRQVLLTQCLCVRCLRLCLCCGLGLGLGKGLGLGLGVRQTAAQHTAQIANNLITGAPQAVALSAGHERRHGRRAKRLHPALVRVLMNVWWRERERGCE